MLRLAVAVERKSKPKQKQNRMCIYKHIAKKHNRSTRIVFKNTSQGYSTDRVDVTSLTSDRILHAVVRYLRPSQVVTDLIIDSCLENMWSVMHGGFIGLGVTTCKISENKASC